MAEMTLEQRRALAIAAARARAQAGQGATPTPAAPARPEPSQPFQRAGGYGPVLAGVADAGIRAALGVKQLFGGLSEEDKAILRELEAEKKADPEKGWRTTGDVVGNIALTAVPATKVAKATQAALGGGRLAATAAGAASSGLTEGLIGVGEGDSTAEQLTNKGVGAAKSAALGGALSGAVAALSKPFQASVEAKQLMSQGVYPTLQQGASSKAGKFVGGLASGAVDTKSRQQLEVLQALEKRIAGPGGALNIAQDTGEGAVETARDFLGKQYQGVLGNKRYPLAPRKLGAAVAAAGQTNKQGQFQQAANEAQRVVGDIVGPDYLNKVNRNVNYETLNKQYLKPLQDAIFQTDDPQVAKRLRDARQYLIDNVRNNRLTPNELNKLKDIDIRNFDVERLREAVKGAAGQQEGVSLAKLANAYSAHTMPGNTTKEDLIGPAMRVIGANPVQEQSRTALMAAKRAALPAAVAAGWGAGFVSSPLAAAMAVPYGVSLAGQTKAGARALFGDYAAQQTLADLLRRGILAPVAPAVVGE